MRTLQDCTSLLHLNMELQCSMQMESPRKGTLRVEKYLYCKMERLYSITQFAWSVTPNVTESRGVREYKKGKKALHILWTTPKAC